MHAQMHSIGAKAFGLLGRWQYIDFHLFTEEEKLTANLKCAVVI